MSNRNGSDGDIYRMSFSGSDVVRLTDNAGVEGAPAVSRDGSMIAFHRQGGGTSGIYTMTAGGASERLARAMFSAGSMSFSPDGTRIAFVNTDANVGPTNEIFIMNSDGTGLVQFSSGALANGRGLAWSPDGTRLAFVNNTPAPNVYFVALAGGPKQRVVTGDEPSFSPDGSLILYRRIVGATVTYFVANLSGSGEQAVLSLSGIDRAVFHPNGTSLFFDRSTPQWDIFRIDSTGSTANVSNNGAADRMPAVRGSP